jgi:protein phosphatase
MLKIELIGKTDVGLVRSNNEDTFITNQQAGYCLVADGMGGAAAGETASRIFAQTAEEIFTERAPVGEQEIIESVQSTFRRANDRILAHVAERPEHQGMGCTAEVLAFTQSGFVIGHMGDSRTYRYRQGVLKQLTKDHSLVQDQLDQGLITEEQARTHTMRNVILRAVGVRPSPALDTLRGPVYPGDLFLLCSDGLTDMIADETIEQVLALDGDLGLKTEHLVDLAKKAGGKDNITVVLTQIG